MTVNVPVMASQNNSMLPSDHELMVYQTMAKQAVSSKMYRGMGDEAAVVTIMLSARELGVPPMLALNGGINIIQGKAEISARLMSAMIRKCGHSIQEVISTDEECTLVGRRADNGDTITCSFNIQEASRAGLIKEGGGWKKWPKDMLYARCISRLARRLYSDVIGTGYVEGEISESVQKPFKESSPDHLEIIPHVDEGKLLGDFLSQFDKEEAMGWSKYIHLIKDKLSISVEKIIEKYNANPEEANIKYQKWLEMQP